MERSIRKCRGREIDAYRLMSYSSPFPPHFHNFLTVGLMLDGSRGINGSHARKGDVIIIPPRCAHSCQSEEMFSYISLVFRSITLPYSSFRIIRNSGIESMVYNLHMMIEFGRNPSDKDIAELISSTAEGREEKEASRASLAVRYISGHLSERMRLKEIADAADCSEATLSRIFRAEYGISPAGYIASERIGMAMELLDRGVTIAEAASRAGFSDQSHLTKVFSAVTGITPGRYAKERKDE